MAISRLSIIKFLELAIAVTCIGLHYKSEVPHDFNTNTLSVAAFGGFVIILVGGFAGHLMSTPINRRIDIFFCLVGCATFIAAGAMNIEYFKDVRKSEYRDYGLAKASLAIIGGALFLIDSLLTWRGDF
ncbi:uncharacterized protein LOC123003643 [Tribolium madens]|uniref:uncharacterized protein LOC123003643 n=1 Tax=Tribolium madens TaxID=41895 RepID=UPI001CF74C6C|nr:uncharacterized protein LOC123003643 [Tribolium madens]